MTMNIQGLRHGRESIYGLLTLGVGAVIWLALLVATMGGILLMALISAVFLYTTEKFFRVTLYGNALLVSERQFPEVHRLLVDSAKKMGVSKLPTTFVLNSHGVTNAVAVRFLSGKYVLLYSELVDLLHEESGKQQLQMVIAHELAHHRAGHLNFWANAIRSPALFVPFLGAAYSRAKEYTADRIAAATVGNKQACQTALVALALGSDHLRDAANIEAFKEQERFAGGLYGFYQEILSSHPRFTRRIEALDRLFAAETRLIPAASGEAPLHASLSAHRAI